ncbi:hypothetical protein L596_026985 [Steinernema carpocapsae]|uniref:RNA helicase n=1 Tax=Steinernema carpocapsae TaxID=34508 RepID=A0A4U5M310_STECR|nr:hypothetical protein L596_026985 [Steinernema carpocapsae]
MCDTDGEEENFNELNAAYNRKQKKAGGWQALGLDHTVFKGIEKKGFRQPTPIQRKAIPAIIDGKDVVAMSRTGSGKTAAFVVPMLQKLKRRDAKGIRALLISPTRELAMQTFKVVKELGKLTGLRCAVLVGGDSIEDQFAAIHENPDVLIATPGRLLHLVVEMNLKLNSVNYVVFDEADRLFEMGFADQLQEVIKRLPENRQTLLFSATLPKMLVDFAKAGLSDPLLVRLDVDTKVSDKLSMIFLTCRVEDKMSALLYLSRKAVAAGEQTIIFCATMKEVEYVINVFERAKLACTYIYSQLDTVARKVNIARFRDKMCNLLVVTDVAARGVDIPLLDNAINYNFPPKSKLFVHRVGRVARAGNVGRSYSLVSPDEMPYLVDLFLFFGRPLKFATGDSVYKEDEPLVGTFPEHLVDLEVDFLRSIHDNCDDMDQLKFRASNAMGKYMRTRTQPSSESVRRVKRGILEESMNASPHPMLEEIDTSDEVERFKMLQSLRNFKPSSTIFEVHTATKKLQADIMREKRKQHQHFIDKKAVTLAAKQDSKEEEKSADVGGAATNEDVESTFAKVITERKYNAESEAIQEAKKMRKRRHVDQREKEKAEHYIAYAPADAHSEAGFAVDRGFIDAAKSAAVDISADDDKGLYKAQHKKVWDRKTKKFVGQAGDDPAKKWIRTEDGTRLPASYKSGRYENWQQQQKTQFRRGGGEEDGEDGDGPRGPKKGGYRPGQKRFTFKKKSRGRGNKEEKGQHPKGGRPQNELKSMDVILKERRKKEKVIDFQNQRRIANEKKKSMQGKKK